ncbi:Vegetative incompatibility protein HET-E-1 [Colletotrichum siamense]|nr:Vegetative incompatibility protein HET-E-1 [Colletotrichum siamense]
MFLLNTKTLHLESIKDPSKERYAILSHTWGENEVSFKDLQNFSRAKTQAGFAKINRTCELALERGLEYAWVDTCCINKDSSAELSEAINSMFSWYQRAAVCFVWLEDLAPFHEATEPSPSSENLTSSGHQKLYDISELGSSRWFSRGWTLQELIAPREVEFYDADWNLRFTKTERTADLSRITGIDEDVLGMRKQLKDVLVGVRMSWAADRETTRSEDLAYCLLGIFDINMPMLYGEGHKAFQRLQEHIVGQYRDDSLFAWQSRSPPDQTYRGVFARSPEEFKACSKLRTGGRFMFSTPGFSLTNKGIKFSTQALKLDNDTYFVMRLGLQCDNCRDRHDIHICLLRTSQGHIRVAPHTCWRPTAARGISSPTKIYCRKDVTLHESQVIQHVAPNPLRVSLDMDPKYLLNVTQYPVPSWNPACDGFCGDALADDFSGFIQVQVKVIDAIDLTLVIHKLVKEAEPDVEVYAQPRDLKGPWKVTEGCVCNDLYQGRRLDGDMLLDDYKMAKLFRYYQPKRTVKLERRSPPGTPPKTVAFEAKVDGLHISVSLVVRNGSSPPVIQALPVVHAAPVIQGPPSFQYPYGSPDFGDTENDGDQDEGEDSDEFEDLGKDDVRDLSPPNAQRGPTADPCFTPVTPTSSGYNTPETESEDSHSPYGYMFPSRSPVTVPANTTKYAISDRLIPLLIRLALRKTSKQDQADGNNVGE